MHLAVVFESFKQDKKLFSLVAETIFYYLFNICLYFNEKHLKSLILKL